MNSNTVVYPSIYFQHVSKRLKKKYLSLKQDLAELTKQLVLEPHTGTPLGNNTFKIRLAIKSKGKGKSGGARVITYVETEIIGVMENNVVNLLTIYDKSETGSISKQEIAALIKKME